MDRWEKGMLAKSLAGHDKGKVYVIINIEETQYFVVLLLWIIMLISRG